MLRRIQSATAADVVLNPGPGGVSPRRPSRGDALMIVARQYHLPDIVVALQQHGRIARCLHRREQEGDQDSNDRGDDVQALRNRLLLRFSGSASILSDGSSCGKQEETALGVHQVPASSTCSVSNAFVRIA